MDRQSRLTLAELVRSQRVAALGTLREGTPFVSLVAYAPVADFSAFLIHVSRLAYHTQDLLADPRASLMISEPDPGTGDPQTLARFSVVGRAREMPAGDPGLEAARQLYVSRFPEAAPLFALGDFAIFRIEPASARFVAGFGRIFNLDGDDLARAAGEDQA